MATWKRVEREIARLFDGRRTGPQGRAIEDVHSTRYPGLALSVKHRESVAKYLVGWLDEARAFAGSKRLGLVVLHPKGERYDRSLVIGRLDDFLEHVAPFFDEKAQGWWDSSPGPAPPERRVY